MEWEWEEYSCKYYLNIVCKKTIGIRIIVNILYNNGDKLSEAWLINKTKYKKRCKKISILSIIIINIYFFSLSFVL